MYSLNDYGSMIADRARMDPYAYALKAAIGPDSVVLDIGAGTGIHALLGTITNPNIDPETTDGSYELMELSSEGRDFQVTTDENGSLWFIVGTDSGFEGLTTIYYSTTSIALEPK